MRHKTCSVSANGVVVNFLLPKFDTIADAVELLGLRRVRELLQAAVDDRISNRVRHLVRKGVVRVDSDVPNALKGWDIMPESETSWDAEARAEEVRSVLAPQIRTIAALDDVDRETVLAAVREIVEKKPPTKEPGR